MTKDVDVRRLAATTLALALLLAGCSGNSDSKASADPSASASAASGSATASAADVAALAKVKVAGDAGAEPKITFDQPFTVTAPVARVVTPGTGDDLVDGQVLAMNFLALSGADGSTEQTTYGAATQPLTLGDASIITELTTVLTGQKVGVRVLLAVPSTESTTIMAIEVASAKTIPSRAEGDAVAPVDGLPTVTLASDGTPTITPAATAAAPTTLVAQPLIKGAGAVVAAGQTVTVNYSGVLWDGTPFDSSWGKSAFSAALTKGSIIDGWVQGLVGQTVGSQVLLVVPPDLGYGATAQGSIPANATLVFVVDILNAS